MVGVYVWNIVITAIILNAAVSIFFKKTSLRGIDAMPTAPIIAGYVYGSYAGILAGIIISTAYYFLNVRAIHYAPLTITTNAIIGFLASLLTGFNIFAVGVCLLLVYHLISGFIVSIFGGLRPGYFAFVIVNILTSISVFYISSFVL